MNYVGLGRHIQNLHSARCRPRSHQELSRQKRDQLDRSKKKAKVDGATQDFDVLETTLLDGDNVMNEEVGLIGSKDASDITIGMALQRKVVSYKDAILGVNGGS